MNARLITGCIMAGSGVSLFARIRGGNGQLITQATLSTITYQVSNLTTGAIAGSGSLTISQVIFDSLQQSDPRWTLDSASQMGNDGSYGYNFAATLDSSAFATTTLAAPALTPQPANVYRIDLVFTPVTGSAFRVSWQAPAIPLYV